MVRGKKETRPTPIAGPHFTFEMWRLRVLLWALIVANVVGFTTLAILE